jgi:hypothetical protein
MTDEEGEGSENAPVSQVRHVLLELLFGKFHVRQRNELEHEEVTCTHKYHISRRADR